MAVVTGWSKDGASISDISVGVGETVTVNANLGREFEYFRDTMSTADTSVATASWSGGFDFSASVSITGVSAGTTETALIGGYDTQESPLAITVLSAEDESYLNKRGLTHFWENIDDIKQDKLTAGAGISITGNTISAMVDSALSSTSTNPVQNAVIYNAIGNVETILSTLNNGGGAQ